MLGNPEKSLLSYCEKFTFEFTDAKLYGRFWPENIDANDEM